MLAQGLKCAVCALLLFPAACRRLAPPAPQPAVPIASGGAAQPERLEVSDRGKTVTLTVSGSARIIKDVGGRTMYLPVLCMEFEGQPASFIRRGGDYLFHFEPVSEKLVDDICARRRVDEVTVWYGSFTSEQRKRILRKFPKCTIFEDLNTL
jgi:hypothetical protein